MDLTLGKVIMLPRIALMFTYFTLCKVLFIRLTIVWYNLKTRVGRWREIRKSLGSELVVFF